METMYTYTFDEKETLIFAGLKVYITGCLGEYLDESQIDSLAQILRKFRTRPAEVEFAENYCIPLTKDNILGIVIYPERRSGRMNVPSSSITYRRMHS